ncbi:MAG: hypothetical protein KDC38_16415, partial [Planctomycetes bacterium]|nr:hypothetical protein [Planctomycetota bacterium]
RFTPPRLPLPRRSGYAPLPGRLARQAQVTDHRRFTVHHAIDGGIMFAAHVATMLTIISAFDLEHFAWVLVAALVSLGVASLVLLVAHHVGSAVRALRPAMALEELGLAGVQPSSSLAGLRQRLLDAVRRTHDLEAISCDGLEILSALSHNAREALEAPHPDLRGARIRLFLIPPRSGTIDPETRGRSTAEIAVARLGISPEEHWRRLETALKVRHRWHEEYGLSITIRFLECRPLFRIIRAGTRFWFHPWETRNAWIETRPSEQSGINRSLRQALIEATYTATDTFRAPSAGPTKTTFIKKGVEVPGLDSSSLEIEDCTELA